MANKANLVEVTKGKTGYGFLFENDGYISPTEGKNKELFEHILKESAEGQGFNCPYPFRVQAVFQKFGIENANGRIYPEEVLKREVEKYQQRILEHRAYGELNHPTEVVIDLDRVAMNITELHWENHTLVGEVEIPITEGFRRSGIISCCADKTAHWLLSGLKIGVSSRGVGSVSQKYGKTIVGDDYDLVCWDVVSDPSTPQAFIAPPGQTIEKTWVENTSKSGAMLTENATDKFSQFDAWLKG